MSGGELVETTPEAAVVVGSRFCAPAATAFAVTKTISVTGRDFTVTDARGAAVMQVEAAVFSFLQHRSLLLRSSTRRRAAPLLTLQDPTLLSEHEVGGVQGGQHQPEEPALRRGEDGARAARQDQGDDSDCAVIAQISRQSTAGGAFLGRHTYTARINPGVEQAFILALTVILDQMHH
ncbi:hypothetical protein TRIUR3_30252 [Triticum urartu]|uniref:Protein LURP-one-related 15 n=1 Tax=Triticum urartu TaxID=4572 RepID=M7ZK18_TRIUA|nr:hypothetical protein TRIUR3_30252 [Triticum urartu]